MALTVENTYIIVYDGFVEEWDDIITVAEAEIRFETCMKLAETGKTALCNFTAHPRARHINCLNIRP